jgi:hypothetical protein
MVLGLMLIAKATDNCEVHLYLSGGIIHLSLPFETRFSSPQSAAIKDLSLLPKQA